LLLAGEHEQLQLMLSAEMRAALGPARAEELRAELVSRQGEVQEIGKAWKEDILQRFHRYRVPIRFEKGTVDFRIVLDGESRIAGLWLVPHIEPPDEAGAAGPPGPEIEITVGPAERALPGTLTLPSTGGPFPAVVLVHGSGPNDRDGSIGPNKPFRDLAWGLAERGIAVLRYDKRSLARAEDLKEAGARLTVREEVIDDALAALELLRSRGEIDAARLYVLGHSLGGTLAPRIVAAEPRPAGVIVMAGMTLPLPEKMLEQTRYAVSLDGAVSPEERSHLERIESAVRSLRAALDGTGPSPEGYLLGAPIAYFEDLEAHDPPAEAARLGMPVLVLQGRRDYQVTLEDFALWRGALSDVPGACLVLYDDLDHLFRAGKGPSVPEDYSRRAAVEPEVVEDIAEWIREGRCPASPFGSPPAGRGN
jgi:dienelactone hydrolase